MFRMVSKSLLKRQSERLNRGLLGSVGLVSSGTDVELTKPIPKDGLVVQCRFDFLPILAPDSNQMSSIRDSGHTR